MKKRQDQENKVKDAKMREEAARKKARDQVLARGTEIKSKVDSRAVDQLRVRSSTNSLTRSDGNSTPNRGRLSGLITP